MSFTWSDYSNTIYSRFTDTLDNLIIKACPGSGKTTNLEYIATLAKVSDETVYLAFQRSTVDEAKAKLPRHITVSTLHSLGKASVDRAYDRPKIDKWKVRSIIDKVIKYSPKDRSDRASDLSKAVSLLKISSNMVSGEDFDRLLDIHDIDGYDGIVDHAFKVLGISDNNTKEIDFDDMIRFPVIYNLPVQSFDNILGDEVQDWNYIQAQLVSKIKGRYVLVGDSHQAIYGFRGAMNNSMEVLKEHFNCVELPLSISYRCPALVVGEARRLYDDIETWDESIIGEVRYGDSDTEGFDTVNSLVVCRFNRPLISLAYQLLRQGVPCQVRGRDIGKGLVSVIKKTGASSIRELLDSLSQWKDTEVYKATEKGNEGKVESIMDKYESVLCFTEGITYAGLNGTVQTVVDKIDDLFSRESGVLLSTVHKAKGLEARDVYILESKDIRSKFARLSWQKEQEKNIEYVAVTRSKGKLVYM